MRNSIATSFIVFGLCMAGAMATTSREMGRFIAPRGANGTNGTNGINGTNGADGCPPLISSDTKDANGCFIVKQRSQVRNNGTCTGTGSWTTIDTVCDCRPTETRIRCYGTGANACADNTRSGVKITTTQCDGSQPSVSYIYDNNCGITVASVADVHQDNDSTKPVTHKRVTFKDCNNNTLSTTADVPVGTDGAACEAEVVTTACGPVGTASVRCGDTAKRGIKVERKNCSGQIVDADTQYIYNGDDGTSFKYRGTVADCSALPTSPTPEQNDAYLVTAIGKLCIYPTTGGWNCPGSCVEFTGPAGESNCSGLESSQTAVKSSTLAYTGPTKTNQSDAYYTERGKMVRTNVMCNTSLNNTTEDLEDSCVQIVKPTASACTGVYMECTPKGTYTGNTNYSKYNLCVTTTGTTIESALSNKEDNPCAGTNANSTTIVKQEKTTTGYDKGSQAAGETYYTTIGKRVVTRETCNPTGNSTYTVEDRCVEVAKPSGKCTGNTSVYLECTDQTKTSSDLGYKYNVCQTITGTSLSNKIANAVTASALATTLGNTYLKPTDNISADQLPPSVITTGNLASNNIVTTSGGKINADILPNTVVTTTSLGTAVQTEVESQIHDAELVSQSDLGDYVKTSGLDSNSISNVLSSNNVVTTTNVGSCTAIGTPTGKVANFNCTGALATLFDVLAPVINAAADGNTVSRQ